MGPYDFLGIALNAILKSDLRPTTAVHESDFRRSQTMLFKY
jgi:hypothetical protein